MQYILQHVLIWGSSQTIGRKTNGQWQNGEDILYVLHLYSIPSGINEIYCIFNRVQQYMRALFNQCTDLIDLKKGISFVSPHHCCIWMRVTEREPVCFHVKKASIASQALLEAQQMANRHGYRSHSRCVPCAARKSCTTQLRLWKSVINVLYARTDPRSGSISKNVVQTSGTHVAKVPSYWQRCRFLPLCPVVCVPFSFQGIDLQGLITGSCDLQCWMNPHLTSPRLFVYINTNAGHTGVIQQTSGAFVLIIPEMIKELDWHKEQLDFIINLCGFVAPIYTT